MLVQNVANESGSVPGAEFGASVSLDSTLTVAVGAPGTQRGEVTLLEFDDPDNQLALGAPSDASDFGTTVQLIGDLAIVGALSAGQPTAILRTIAGAAKGTEIRLDGNLVATANEQIFSAANPGAGTAQAALDREVIHRNGMEL